MGANAAAAPAFAALALMILWAAHDGGYDTDTWYWGALVLLGLLAATVGWLGAGFARLRPGAHGGADRVRAVRRLVLPFDHLGGVARLTR